MNPATPRSPVSLFLVVALCGLVRATPDDDKGLPARVQAAVAEMQGASLAEIFVTAEEVADLGEAVVPLLLRELDAQDDPFVQLGCLRALADLDQSERIEDHLLKLAGADSSPEVRVAALDIVSALPPSKGLAERIGGELDRTYDPFVKVALAKALNKVGPEYEDRKKATDELKNLLKSESRDFRVAGALALAELGDFESARVVLHEVEGDPGIEGQLARAYIKMERLHAYYGRQEERLLAQSQGDAGLGNLNVLREIMDDIEQQHLYGELYTGSEGEEKLVTAAAKGMLALVDPHSTYFSPTEYERWLLDLQRNYAGIGAYVNTINGRFTITRPIYSGPAFKVGLRSDDEIRSVDGWETYDQPQQDVIDRLKGKPGTPVVVEVMRVGWREPRKYSIVRGVIDIPSVRAELFPGGIGYVEVETFASGENTSTSRELREALDELVKRGAKAFVLDLRYNPGGYMQEAIEMVGEFVGPKKLAVYTQGRHGDKDRKDYYTVLRARGRTEPLVVLINQRSASASEIVAGALRHYERAELVGLKTFGKGSVQNPFGLESRKGEVFADRNRNGMWDPDEDYEDSNGNGKFDYSSMFKLTTQRYYLPGGQSIHTEIDADGRVITEGGIRPDHEVRFEDPTSVWKQEELSDIIERDALKHYVDDHFDMNDPQSAALAVDLAESDGFDASRYPGLADFYASLDTHLDVNDIRRYVRLALRDKVSDARKKPFPGNGLFGDFQEDNQLQYGIVVLLEKLGLNPRDIPEYAAFADIRSKTAELAAKREHAKNDR